MSGGEGELFEGVEEGEGVAAFGDIPLDRHSEEDANKGEVGADVEARIEILEKCSRGWYTNGEGDLCCGGTIVSTLLSSPPPEAFLSPSVSKRLECEEASYRCMRKDGDPRVIATQSFISDDHKRFFLLSSTRTK